MSNAIKILMVDDHQIVLDGLQQLLQTDNAIEIVAATTKSEQVAELLQKHKVDILLTDIEMPLLNGIDLAKQVRHNHAHIKILALSMNNDGALINQMIDESDISGYVLKNTSRDELLTAIKKIAAGGIYFSDEALTQMEKSSQIKKENETTGLSAREIEIIQCIEKEMSNKQIADALFISERTVETHRKNILRKTKAGSVLGLIKYAYSHKLIKK
jgi:two-component system, NarL family, nitrate/nitrite response regulator NarL